MKYMLYIGLILNIAGTLLISFSFGKNLAEAHQIDDKGRKIYLASFLHPQWFKWGIALLGIGFLL
jgi:hypothetical protein